MRPTRTFTGALVAALASTLLASVLAAPAWGVASILEVHEPLPDVDRRAGAELSPTAAQLAIVRSLRAHADWNDFGTPLSLINYSGDLGAAPGEPAVAAREWIDRHRGLFRLTADEVANLEVVNDTPLSGIDAVPVLFGQRFGDLPVGTGGTIMVLVDEGRALYVSSSAAGGQGVPEAPAIEPAEAWATAARNAGIDVGGISVTGTQQGWTSIDGGLSEPGRVRLRAVPQISGGVRPAFESLVMHVADNGLTLGYRTFVDAVTGKVLLRKNIVAQALDNPQWKFFTSTPPVNFNSNDTRIVGCWDAVQQCDYELKNDESHVEWDVEVATGQPTFTTKGNSANTSLSSLSPLTPSDNYRPVSPDREYVYPWTNYWYEEKCPRQNFSPDMERNDIHAAIVNLFTMHNRIHDWAYRLGFTEPNYNLQQANVAQGGAPNDPETGNAAAGFVTGGAPTFTGRDNANQITPPDGVSPVTNMYLWQQAAGAFYPPCVDGDYDMSVIVHEYTHAISNRMVAGPNDGLDERQGGSMGESWSDLDAMEFLNEHNYVPVGNENPYAVGPYVTGNLQRGIRNFAMNNSPLNYSDIGYDITGAQVHADGEIWSATNFDIRKKFIKKYNADFPANDEDLQLSCAEGQTPTNLCPGNRRWAQVMFDAWLLMALDVEMPQARDAYLAADKARFNGDNQKILWNAFAKRGLGKGADDGVDQPTDDIAKPSFLSPKSKKEGSLRFKATSGGKRVKAKIFVGRFEARVTPVADTKRKSKKYGSRVKMMPGRYEFLAQAKGYGMVRFKTRVGPNSSDTVRIKFAKNHASKKQGATATATEETPVGLAQYLIDDTESTNWTAARPAVKGAAVTVDLAGKRPVAIRRLQVSAMLRPRNVIAGQGDPNDPAQNRFTALRSFKVLACKNNCDTPAGFKVVYTSPKDAFPSIKPRPIGPDFIVRTFKVKRFRATHVILEVVSNQCTGQKQYHGEQDSDATNDTDCRVGSAHDDTVRAAEFQVFSKKSRVR